MMPMTATKATKPAQGRRKPQDATRDAGLANPANPKPVAACRVRAADDGVVLPCVPLHILAGYIGSHDDLRSLLDLTPEKVEYDAETRTVFYLVEGKPIPLGTLPDGLVVVNDLEILPAADRIGAVVTTPAVAARITAAATAWGDAEDRIGAAVLGRPIRPGAAA
jgi:hypothetical protein